jgi:hypothetical protein
VATFGIDIWMTTMAVTEGYRLCQARLGIKLHGKKDPGSQLGEMFREVVITMFGLMEDYEEVWKKVKGSTAVDIVGAEPEEEPEAFPVDKELLVENFKVGYNHFSAFWKSILSKADMKMIREMHKLKPDELHMDIDLWARILFDFAATFHKWSRNKVKLINMLTPLYYANLASFINRTGDMSNEEAEQVIEGYARRFEDLKPYLVKEWNKAASG